MKKESKKQEKKPMVNFHQREIFTIVENNIENETKFIVTFANYKLKEFNELAEAELYIMERPWEMLIQVIGIINELYNKTKKEKK